MLKNTVCKSTTTNMGSPFFWNVMSQQLEFGFLCSGPYLKVLMSKKNKVSHRPLTIKPLYHLKMLETNYLVTWNNISRQRPQLQQCKSQKMCTCKNMAMMQNMLGYTQQFQVHGDFKIRKLMDSSISIFVCSVTDNILL